MTRQALPACRIADVISFNHEGRRWTVTFGRFSDGRLAEIFLDADKESPLADAARESAILVSLALQYGCDANTIRHALDGRSVSPTGAALALIEAEQEPSHEERLEAAAADLPLHFQRNGDA